MTKKILGEEIFNASSGTFDYKLSSPRSETLRFTIVGTPNANICLELNDAEKYVIMNFDCLDWGGASVEVSRKYQDTNNFRKTGDIINKYGEYKLTF